MIILLKHNRKFRKTENNLEVVSIFFSEAIVSEELRCKTLQVCLTSFFIRLLSMDFANKPVFLKSLRPGSSGYEAKVYDERVLRAQNHSVNIITSFLTGGV